MGIFDKSFGKKKSLIWNDTKFTINSIKLANEIVNKPPYGDKKSIKPDDAYFMVVDLTVENIGKIRKDYFKGGFEHTYFLKTETEILSCYYNSVVEVDQTTVEPYEIVEYLDPGAKNSGNIAFHIPKSIKPAEIKEFKINIGGVTDPSEALGLKIKVQ